MGYLMLYRGKFLLVQTFFFVAIAKCHQMLKKKVALLLCTFMTSFAMETTPVYPSHVNIITEHAGA